MASFEPSTTMNTNSHSSKSNPVSDTISLSPASTDSNSNSSMRNQEEEAATSAEVESGTDTAGTSPNDPRKTPVATGHTKYSSLSWEPIPPSVSPHMTGRNFTSVTVEDYSEEEGAQTQPADTSSASFCVTLPAVTDMPDMPRALDRNLDFSEGQPHPLEDSEGLHRFQRATSNVSASRNPSEQESKSRLSVIDYLVSQSSVEHPDPVCDGIHPLTQRNMHAWPGPERGVVSGVGGQHNTLNDYQGKETSQPNWNSQYSSFHLKYPTGGGASYGSDGTLLRETYTQPVDHHTSAPSSSFGASQSDTHSDPFSGNFHLNYAGNSDTMAPSGYQLLAAKLSGDAAGQAITPIYRRFDSLTHRLLLYIQDEISDLEKQLNALEFQETVKRSYAGGVIPASRRKDRWIHGNLTDQKIEVLGLIGYKLSQYSQVLSSFRKLQDIPAPTWRDIHLYKTYLTTSKLIVDDETRFLDVSNDLISLLAQHQTRGEFHGDDDGDGPTPIPEANEGSHFLNFLKDGCSSLSTRADNSQQKSPTRTKDGTALRLALSCMSIVFVPIMTFLAIPSFIGRMAIILVISLGIGVATEQSPLLPELGRRRLTWIVFSGLYIGAMAVIARAFKW